MQGDSNAEATLATKLAQGFASKLLQMQRPPEADPARPQRTMSGFGERRTADEQTSAQTPLWGVEGMKA
jgi:hypothetical protein